MTEDPWVRAWRPGVDWSLCRVEEDDDATGSTWLCTLTTRHIGDHETWTAGVLRHRWPRAPRELVEVQPRRSLWWRVVRRWIR